MISWVHGTLRKLNSNTAALTKMPVFSPEGQIIYWIKIYTLSRALLDINVQAPKPPTS